ncbi:MAG: DinB family protein [FCB group bacterium]|jgi:hypothetical protein|nr:DinB family protein [FCB group bacterium]
MDIHTIIASQYRATLDMLTETVNNCPEALWVDPAHENQFWHIAYHTLFFAHLYLHNGERDFVAWEKHRREYQFLGPVPWPPHHAPRIEEPYTQTEIAEYLAVCREEVERKVPSLDLEAPSGFPWLHFNKLELQFYNIRHIQHHVGQLTDRLRNHERIGVQWIAARQA